MKSAVSKTMKSPLGGLQKLSDELRAERQKSTAALQDRARLKIERDTLKSRMEETMKEVIKTQESKDAVESEKRGLVMKVNELENHVRQNKEDIESLTAQLLDTSRKLEDEKLLQKGVKEEAAHYTETIKFKIQHTEGMESRLRDAQAMIGELQAEADRSRRLMEAAEQKYETSAGVVREQAHQIAQLQSAAEQTEKLRAEFSKVSNMDNQLRLDLQEATSKQVALSNQVHEAEARATHEAAKVEGLRIELADALAEQEKLKRDMEESEMGFSEMQRRLDAEAQAGEAAKTRSDVASKARESLQNQLDDLKFAHESVLEGRNRVEEDFNRAVKDLEVARRENMNLRDANRELECQVTEAEGTANLAVEVEFLRGQLAQLRQSEARRDVEQDAAVMAPKTVLEREEESRKMFEGIIFELRAELERATDAHTKAEAKLEENTRRAALVEQYEQEVQMYREAAKTSAMETHSAVATASEAQGRTERLGHEKEMAHRRLRQAESDLVSAKAQIDRLKEEITATRRECRQRHLEKLAAERTAAEHLATISRLEGESDTASQVTSLMKNELEVTKAKLREAQAAQDRMVSREDDLRRARDDAAMLESKLRESARTAQVKEAQLNGDLQSVKMKLQTLSSEYEALKSTTHSLRVSLDDSHIVTDTLRLELEQSHRDRDNSAQASLLREQSRAEVQIQGLRSDLEQTVRSWRDSEQVRQDKDESLQHLRRELAREKERVHLLKSQVTLLEDRLRVNLQELNVYRSLDMYKSGMSKEMQNTRPASHTSKSADQAETAAVASNGLPTPPDVTVGGHVADFPGTSPRRRHGISEGMNESSTSAPERRHAMASSASEKFSMADLKDDIPVRTGVGLRDGPTDAAATTTDGARSMRDKLTLGLSRLDDDYGDSSPTKPTTSAASHAGASARDRSGMPSRLDFDKARRLMQQDTSKKSSLSRFL